MLSKQIPDPTSKDRTIHSVILGDIWVHPTLDGRQVCEVAVTVPELKFMPTGTWRFEDYAVNGQTGLMLYDTAMQDGNH